MSVQKIDAGGAFFRLFVDNGPFDRGLTAAIASVKAMGAAITSIGTKLLGIGTAILAPMALSTKVFADMGSAIADASGRTGIAAEHLTALKYAADQSGSSLADVETAVKKMSKIIVAGASGSESAAEMISKLGLSAEQLATLKPDEAFRVLAEALSKVEDPMQRSAFALGIFGKSGTKLLPMMSAGAAGLDAMADKATSLGLIMSSEDVAAADRFGDSLHDLWSALKMNVFQIGAALVPSLQSLVDIIAQSAGSMSKWISDNRGLVVAIGGTALAITGLGAAMVVAGQAIAATGTILAGFKLALTALAAPELLAVGAALILVGGSLAAVAVASGKAGDAFNWLGEQFAPLAKEAMELFQGIGDALAAGDMKLAADILWAGIRAAFQSGDNWVQSTWLGFTGTILDTFDTVTAELKGTGAELFRNIASTIQTTNDVIAAGIIDTRRRVGLLSEDAANAALALQGKRSAFVNDKINKAADTAKKKFGQERDQSIADRKTARDAAILQGETDLQNVLAELAALKRQAAEQVKKGIEVKAPKPPQIAPRVQEVAENLDSRGTFAAGLIRQFGGQAANKQLKATEKGNGLLEDIKKELQDQEFNLGFE